MAAQANNRRVSGAILALMAPNVPSGAANVPNRGPNVPKPSVNNSKLNALVNELNGTKRPYKKTGAFLRGAGAAGKGLLTMTVQGVGRVGGLTATAIKRLTRTNAALLAKLQTELKNLESKENPTNENRKAIVNKTARIGQLLGTKSPVKRANIAAVAGYATGKNGLPQPSAAPSGSANNTNFNFSSNPYTEIIRARHMYNRANRATKQQIVGKIMKGMANIWRNRSSNTVAKATLKHIVNRGPKHANIAKMYESLAGRGSSSSSSNISRLLGLRPGSSSSSSLASLAPSLLRSLGGSSSNFERLLRGSSAPQMPMAPPPSYPMAPPPSYPPMAVPSYPMAAPMPPMNQLPPSIRTAVNNAGGSKRVNNMIQNIGGPEMVKVTSRALVKAHGNINVAARQTGMPPRVFQNIKNLGGPKVATRIVVVQRRSRPVVVKRRRVVVVKRRPTVTKRHRVVKKKTRRVSVRKGPTIKDIKKLVHKLHKSELETRVVQCLMR